MQGRYIDLHVTSDHSFGTDSIETLIKFAEKLDLGAITIADKMDSISELKGIKKEIDEVKTDLKVYLGAEISASKEHELRKKIQSFRDKVDILVVSGGLIDINRAAVSDPRVDILAHPEYNRRDSGLDYVMVTLAGQNNVAIELNFRQYLHSYRKIRSYLLAHMRTNVMLADKFNAPVVVTSAAESRWDLRGGRELASLAYICGMNLESALKTVTSVPEYIIQKAEKVKSKGFVMPGVEVKEE